MTGHLTTVRIGPGASVQDTGRKGNIGIGLSRGGAADRQALLRGSALLGNAVDAAALEMTVGGGRFRVSRPTRIAMTGAYLGAKLNGTGIENDATYEMNSDDLLEIGAANNGAYGYLHVAGGLLTDQELGGRGRHVIAGLGRDLSEKDELPFGTDPEPGTPPMRLTIPAPSADPILVIPGPQTGLFPEEVRARFEATTFVRSPKGNRQGVRMDFDGEPFATEGQLARVSDFIMEGDIQMTGDGTPYVLLAECQTMGGYPRIGTVIPKDLPRVAQALPGQELKFRFASLEDAEKTWRSDEEIYREYRRMRDPRIRDPREMADLLSFELIDRPDPDVAG